MEDFYQAGSRILEIARRHPHRLALVVDGESWSYAQLVSAAEQLAEQFPPTREGESQPITASMADRHFSSYAGILAARLSGHAYVPLNVNHPAQRNAVILQGSGARRVITGQRSADKLQDILTAVPALAETVATIHCGDLKADYRTPGSTFFAQRPGREHKISDLAYILFTSGSTGSPKGVPIGNSQLETYLKAVRPMLDVRPNDRFSQTFDLTFDVSVHDMFVCWENGATLVVPSRDELRKPADFIRQKEITCWFSVPSLAYQMRVQNDLSAGAFPGLRVSLFAGEALPSHLALEWAAAAPNSSVENWYGPTEATIVCSRYVLAGEPIHEDTVPIGKAFPEMELFILDEKLAPCPVGVAGGLFLAGAQVAAGYLNDAKKTADSFLTLPGDKRVYRTGDRAVLLPDGNIRFLGRLDNQVKVRGYRIELGEIEAALRSASGGKNVVALAWPCGSTSPTSIVAALETDAADTGAIQNLLRAALPDYMVPTAIFLIPAFPKNASGKVDRKALAAQLDRQSRDDREETPRQMSPQAESLLEAILLHAPLLDRRAILESKNLFLAGIDSLAFIGLTMELERRFQMVLDQDRVVRLAEMSFDQMLNEVRGGTSDPPSKIPTKKRSLLGWLSNLGRGPRTLTKHRANRAVQFIERFPGYLAKSGAPDVLAIGSSGTFRGFSPTDFAAAAAQYRVSLRALNSGFPAVNLRGMRMLCEFVRDQCQAANARIPLIVYELDPMQISDTPPGGEISLGSEYFSGRIRSIDGGSREFEWDIPASGAWSPSAESQKVRLPNWVRQRDQEIARVYVGDIEFVPEAVDAWYAGARALAEVCDSMVCFIPPCDRAMTDEIKPSRGTDKLARFTAEISQALGISVLWWEAFHLAPADFRDINHVNSPSGREKLSQQLARMLFADSSTSKRQATLTVGC